LQGGREDYLAPTQKGSDPDRREAKLKKKYKKRF
jgi:hypothetical protein